MATTKYKIKKQVALVILAIMVSGLLNICLFTLKARAAGPVPAPRFFYNHETCALEQIPQASQTFNYPSAPMPACCLERGNYYRAIVKTDNDKQAPVFMASAVSSADDFNLDNSTSNDTSVLIYPPPELKALATIIIRE